MQFEMKMFCYENVFVIITKFVLQCPMIWKSAQYPRKSKKNCTKIKRDPAIVPRSPLDKIGSAVNTEPDSSVSRLFLPCFPKNICAISVVDFANLCNSMHVN